MACVDDEYFIEVDVTDLGTSSQYVVSDDLGNQQSTDIATILTFGPYSGINPVTKKEVLDKDHLYYYANHQYSP